MPTKTQEDNKRYCKSWYERMKQNPAKWRDFLAKRVTYRRGVRSNFSTPGAEPVKIKQVRWVYLIEAAEFGHIKVGIAANPAFRMKGLQTGSSTKLTLRVCYPCDHSQAAKIERELHRKLEPYRVSGEWFKSEAPLLQEMLKVEPELARIRPGVS